MMGAVPAWAGCERAYTVALSGSGFYSYLENHQHKGVYPTVLAEVTRRTGCRFETEMMPRARIWLQWAAGAIDFDSGVAHLDERDSEGVFVPVCHLQEDLISTVPSPDGTLKGWLNLPKHPLLGRVRGGLSASTLDPIMSDPRYAAQDDAGTGQTAITRKLFAGRDVGIILDWRSFESNAKDFGPAIPSLTRQHLKELPPVPTGFYLRLSSVTAADRRLLIEAIDTMTKSGFNDAVCSGDSDKAALTEPRRGH